MTDEYRCKVMTIAHTVFWSRWGKEKQDASTLEENFWRIAGKQNLQSSFQKFKEQSEVKKGSKDKNSLKKVQRTAGGQNRVKGYKFI